MNTKTKDKLAQKHKNTFGGLPFQEDDGLIYFDFQKLGIVDTSLGAARTALVQAYHGESKAFDGDYALEIEEVICRNAKSSDILESSVEALYGQFVVLNTAFNSYVQLSATIRDTEKTRIYFEMAIKAQEQARKTLETINSIKNPQPKAVYIKQEIVQQVNQLLLKTKELQKRVEAQPYAPVDFGSEIETAAVDAGEQALDAIDGCPDGDGEVGLIPKRAKARQKKQRG
jgi:hypothetical protein